MKNKRSILVLTVPFFIAVISIIYLAADAFSDDSNYVTGIVETAQIDVASKLPGRIDSVFVKQGNYVKKGDLLFKLESKEMDAKLEQARGVMNAAKSKSEMAHNGARSEEKEAVEKLFIQAKAQKELAEKTWTRIQNLFNDGIISEQEKDQVEFQFKAAKEQMLAAKAKLDMVKNGARREEISGADALFYQASNAYNEALAYHKELEIRSPISGEISKIISDPGEIIGAGFPVISLFDPNDVWVVLQIREDQMDQFKKGTKLKGIIPALGNGDFSFEVSYIAPMADFATWKATNQKGGFDYKTFEIHLRSLKPVENLRPGMTVNFKIQFQR